ncbi:hypothetical protein ABIC03_003448 [Bradyrhizobium sp. RT6a]|uniref:hypothetical protein n=1 Tax=unclassified Bradyrhizobium TaxID=2631580 RepID=UPI0033911DB8
MATDNQLHEHPDALNGAAMLSEPLDLDLEVAALEQVTQRFNELIAMRDGIKLAIAIKRHGKNRDAGPDAYAGAEQYSGLARNERRAIVQIDQAEDQLEEIWPHLDAARERVRICRDRRALEVAATYQPRHKKAVREIAKALETLSKAVAAEQQIHIDFLAEMPGVDYLPNFGGAWRSALLGLPNSLGSEWIRWGQHVGFIDQ